MKHITLLLFTALLATNLTQAQSTQKERLQKHLSYMAADSLRGRQAGSPDALKVAQYLAHQYADMGATPLFSDYLVPFQMSDLDGSLSMALSMLEGNKQYRNVAIVIPSRDPKLRHEYILIGAHYDHLGVKNGEVYNGADDNASGSAAMVELARNLLARRTELNRSVIICNFDAEEIGLCGSTALANKLNLPIDQLNLPAGNIFERLSRQGMKVRPIEFCRLMISVDMVGWYQQSGHLQMQGIGTIHHGRNTAQAIAQASQLNLHLKNFETSILTATDTEPFAKLGIPTLDVTTGIKSPYHKPQDDADLIDYNGLNQIVNYLTDLIVEFSQDSQYAASGRVAPKHKSQVSPFELGINVRGGRNWAEFPKAGVLTNAGWGWGAGLSVAANLPTIGQTKNNFSILSGFYYDNINFQFPSHIDFVHPGSPFHQHNLLIPIELQFNLRFSTMAIHLGGGAYFGLLLFDNREQIPQTFASLLCTDNTYGFMWNLGLRIGQWDLTTTSMYQSGNKNLQLNGTRFGITYHLW